MWQCPVSLDHVWEATILSRTYQKSGCPCCTGRKTVKSNCLLTTHPEIAKQWHKDNPKQPDQFTAGSHTRIKWQCLIVEDHVWDTTINNRTSGWGCPCCAGLKAVKSNCLTTTHPEIASQWHSDNKKSASQFVAHSHVKVKWQCPKKSHHIWSAVIQSRTQGGNGCPWCSASKGEQAIEKFLKCLGVDFARDMGIGCKNIRELLFDFIIFKHKEIVGAIEFQGIQHYKPITFGSKRNTAKSLFEKVLKHDAIKRQWCHENKIPLLEIPYFEICNIEKLVKNLLTNI